MPIELSPDPHTPASTVAEEEDPKGSVSPPRLKSAHLPGGLKTVLVGHSMGSACAAEEVVRNPEAVKALVLVAPAILSRTPMPSLGAHSSGKSRVLPETASDSLPILNGAGHVVQDTVQKQTAMPLRVFRMLLVLLGVGCWQLLRLLLWTLQPVLVLVLWMLVRPRGFWEKGLSHAYYQKGFEERTITFYR